MTIEKITSKMVSERRNELIAELLHRIHFIEKRGRGIRLILSREPDTKFDEVGTHFIVTFPRKGFEDQAEKTVQSRGEKTGEKILLLIRENSRVTQQELMRKTGLSRRGVEWNLAKLKAKGLLRRIGPDKGGHWEII